MKNILFSLLVAFLMTSCVVTESLTFNQDGSGKLVYKADMGTMMSMLGDKLGNESDKKSKKNKKKSNELEKEIDSTFSFKEILASKQDSIAKLSPEEQARLKKMEKYNVHMVMSESKKIMYYEFLTDFKTPLELQELVSPLNTITDLNKSSNALGENKTPENNGITSYTFNGKQFKKVVKLKTEAELTEEYKKSLENSGISEEDSGEMSKNINDSMEMIYKESSYIMNVTFPSKIKSISIKNAVISEDGKSATLTFLMENFMKSENLNFEVELE
jgi:hypothetical protein